MAVITPDTFDPLRRYVSVRLQQGVPIVDADWNELDDVRNFEVRAFLKWFVGNGVPENNDGFRIEGTGLANDFFIRAGTVGPPDGLNNVGRCLVDGADIMITADLQFTAQPLHAGQPGSAALGVALGVPQIQPLTAPGADETVSVYVDVWERLVTPAEDPALVLPGLNTESCARIRREWVVRTRSGVGVPVSSDADFAAGHSYYLLATLVRRAGDVTVNASDVTDRRERRLLMPPANLIEDLFGASAADYRRGVGGPLISLRDAINALLRGDLPSSPETAIAPAPGSNDVISRGTFFDATGGLVTTWRSNRTGTNQVFMARLALGAPQAGFVGVQQITSGPGRLNPHAALLPTGEALVVYQTVGGSEDILLKRGTAATLNPGSPETTVSNTPARERDPFVVVAGGQCVIFWHEDAGNTWQFTRYDVAANAFPNPAAALAPIVTTQRDLHAARDSTDTVWAAFRGPGATSDIHVVAVPPAAPPGAPQTLSSPGALADQTPFVMVDNADNVWVFWAAGGGADGIMYRRFLRATLTWEAGTTTVPGTTTDGNASPAAVTDAEGGVWLFWQRLAAAGWDLWYVRQHPVTLAWSNPRQITGQPEPDLNPFALRGPDGTLWLFWMRNLAGGNGELFHRRMFPAI